MKGNDYAGIVWSTFAIEWSQMDNWLYIQIVSIIWKRDIGAPLAIHYAPSH